MPYAALPDRRMPYDNDGTIFGYRNGGGVGSDFSYGASSFLSQATLLEMNDDDSSQALLLGGTGGGAAYGFLYIFFPESREITAIAMTMFSSNGVAMDGFSSYVIQGSADSTNGVDGTWETASISGQIQNYENLDNWRAVIRTISFTGPKKAIRLYVLNDPPPFAATYVIRLHLFGEKAAGATPDDVIFIDHDTTPGVEYQSPEDFGDQPLGTTVVRQFRLKNVSGTKTANTINVQCNDPDFSISTDGTTWVATINITSLSAGAESATMYVRCVTPAPGNLLGPRHARIVVTVASYT